MTLVPWAGQHRHSEPAALDGARYQVEIAGYYGAPQDRAPDTALFHVPCLARGARQVAQDARRALPCEVSRVVCRNLCSEAARGVAVRVDRGTLRRPADRAPSRGSPHSYSPQVDNGDTDKYKCPPRLVGSAETRT